MAQRIELKVAKPCHESWREMRGDDRVRHCLACKLNVYNISELTSDEVGKLIEGTGGKFCGRLYQRRDGTVLTRDCPVGVSTARKRIAYALTLTFAFLLACVGTASTKPATGQKPFEDIKEAARSVEPFRIVIDWIDPPERFLTGVIRAP